MKDSNKTKILDILSSAVVIGVLALLLVVVSWSGGVLNEIKDFDVVKNSVSKVSEITKDMNSTKFFKFSEDKIVGGYKFTLSKIKASKNYIAELYFTDNNSTSDSNLSIASKPMPSSINSIQDKNGSNTALIKRKKHITIVDKKIILSKQNNDINNSTIKTVISVKNSDINHTKELM